MHGKGQEHLADGINKGEKLLCLFNYLLCDFILFLLFVLDVFLSLGARTKREDSQQDSGCVYYL